MPSSSSAEPRSCGVLAQAVEQPRASARVGDALGARQVDELAVQAVARGEPLVLVEHLVRVVRQLPARRRSARHSSLTIAWISAARPSVCSTRVWASITRISTVPKFGCGRTSYQR